MVFEAGQRLSPPFQAFNKTRSRDGSAPFEGHSHRHVEKHLSAGGMALGLAYRHSKQETHSCVLR